MLRKSIVIVLLTVFLHARSCLAVSLPSEDQFQCVSDVAENVFSGIFSSDPANRRQRDKISEQDLRILIEKELERIERGETVEIDPKVVGMVEQAVEALGLIAPQRRNSSCMEELIMIGMFVLFRI